MTVLDAAMSYTQRGWRVFPLSPGDRVPWPGWLDWQGANNAATPQACVDMFGGARSIAGVGIITGRVSGIWVLDVDCKHGKDGRISLAELIAVNGSLPDTYTVETPNGGLHYYWAIPHDFEPTNAGGRGVVAARLGPGLDVRGRGGYVGAPPSRVATEDGGAAPYRVVSAPGVGVAKAPDWLVELVRPPERVDPIAIEAGEVAVTPDLRIRTYLNSAVPALLGELADATQGQRNATAHRVACRLWEWINVGWVDPDQARAHYDMAAGACEARTGGGFDAGPAWGSGRRTVQGRPASMPDIGFQGAELLEFAAEPAGPMRDFSSPGTAAGPARADVAESDADGYVASPTLETPSAAEVWREHLIAQEVARLTIREEAKRRMIPDAPDTDAGYWLLKVGKRQGEIEAIPPAVPLVAGWLWLDTLARVYGPSGHGKSFVVLDIALCVAAGVPWHGVATTTGEVVYVAGEGARGLAGRSKAWRVRHELDELPAAFQLFDEMPTPANPKQWRAFVLAMRVVRPALIVFDTQAWLQAGLNENDGQDMQVLVDGLAQLREATGASVLVVHHTGKNETAGGRGHSSVKGAIDVELEVRREGSRVTTWSRKQKDAEDPAPVIGMMTEVEGVKSVTLVYPGDPWAVQPAELPEGALPLTEAGSGSQAVGAALTRRVVALLRDVAGEGNGVTRAELRTEWRGLVANEGTTKDTLDKQLNRVVSRLDELGRLGKTMGERFIFREFDGLDDLEPASDGAGTMGFGRPLADKTEQTKTKRNRVGQ